MIFGPNKSVSNHPGNGFERSAGVTHGFALKHQDKNATDMGQHATPENTPGNLPIRLLLAHKSDVRQT